MHDIEFSGSCTINFLDVRVEFGHCFNNALCTQISDWPNRFRRRILPINKCVAVLLCDVLRSITVLAKIHFSFSILKFAIGNINCLEHV